jgi:hypothetical protein
MNSAVILAFLPEKWGNWFNLGHKTQLRLRSQYKTQDLVETEFTMQDVRFGLTEINVKVQNAVQTVITL